MPFSRPTLTELRKTVAADIVAGMPDGQELLRYTNVRVLGDAQAGLGHLHYGYLDWIAKQSVPWTATGEYLEGWGALKSVYRKPAAIARGTVTFTAMPGKGLDEGTGLTGTDGIQYVTAASVVAPASGVLTVRAVATTPGAAGNCSAGVAMTLQVVVPGVDSRGSAATAFTGGADTEGDQEFRARVMTAYQNPPRGGAELDYVTWALEVPGVTRAWCLRNGFGAGTVVVYAMFDVAQEVNGGFPVGTDGVASDEARPATKASGNQLAVADSIFDKQPVTALVYACAPLRNRLTLTITGLASASPATRAAIAATVRGVLTLAGSPLGATVNRTDLVTAISAVPQTAGFVLSVVAGNQGGVDKTYPGNITSGIGYLPTLEAVIYAE